MSHFSDLEFHHCDNIDALQCYQYDDIEATKILSTIGDTISDSKRMCEISNALLLLEH